MQEDLKQLSTRSRCIIAKGSTHYNQIDRPDLVNREVLSIIQQVRGTAPEPTNYGTTVMEQFFFGDGAALPAEYVPPKH